MCPVAGAYSEAWLYVSDSCSVCKQSCSDCCVPACWGAPSEVQSYTETLRKLWAGLARSYGTPSPGEDTLPRTQ